MPAFEYVAVDGEGRRQKGIISADSPRSARKELRLRELMALDVTPVELIDAIVTEKGIIEQPDEGKIANLMSVRQLH